MTNVRLLWIVSFGRLSLLNENVLPSKLQRISSYYFSRCVCVKPNLCFLQNELFTIYKIRVTCNDLHVLKRLNGLRSKIAFVCNFLFWLHPARMHFHTKPAARILPLGHTSNIGFKRDCPPFPQIDE